MQIIRAMYNYAVITKNAIAHVILAIMHVIILRSLVIILKRYRSGGGRRADRLPTCQLHIILYKRHRLALNNYDMNICCYYYYVYN